MKTLNKTVKYGLVLHIALLTLFSFFKSELHAQTFPLSGATWYFKDNYPITSDNYAEKWEYKGDSVSVDGEIKKFKVTSKVVNPYWIPFDTLLVTEIEELFLYKGDTIWNMKDSLSPVANFALQVEDSAYTPYHSVFSPLYPMIMESSNNCSQDVQSLFFQKGVVVETNTETQNGFTFKTYKLKYIDELGDTILRLFSERTILTEGYWHYNNVYLTSCSFADYPSLIFLCYKDDYTGVMCSEDEWFDNLSLEGEELTFELITYPNPADETLKIKTNKLGSFTLVVYDMLGKSKITKNGIFEDDNDLSLDVSNLEKGCYIIEISSNEINQSTKFIKN